MIKSENNHIIYKLLVCYIGLSLFFFISCGEKSNSGKDSQVFRYNEHKNILTLDPAFARVNGDIWAVNQIYNGLVQLDDSLNVKPDIAKSWEIKDSSLTYSFILRDDVYFHKHNLFGKDSTRVVTAKDFVYSFNRLVDVKTASPGRWIFNSVSTFYAENETTLIIKLKEPFPAFISLLTNKYCSVVPKEIVEHYAGDFRRNPVGTGAFKFKLWEENIKLVLRKNELYYEKDKVGNQLPYLEAVAITFLPDKQSEFLQFVQGNLDFLNYLDTSYKDELLTPGGKLQPKYQEDIKMITAPYLNTEYLGLYMDSETNEIQSELVRKAINYGFDRKKMVTYLRNGIVSPAVNGFIPKGLPGFNNLKGYTYQPEKARQLLKDYKTQTGIQNPEITITTDANYLDLCEYIQRELEKTGLKVFIDVVPYSTLRQSIATGKLDIFRASWVADYPDAENYLSLFYSRNFTPNGPNYTHFKDSLYDNLYERATSEANMEKRLILYQKMDSLLINKAPLVPLYYDQIIRFTRKNITGLGSNPINLLVLKNVKKSNNF